jgi:hypothetical protein
MPIIPVKLDGVFAYAFGRQRLHGRLEHGQSLGHSPRRFPSFAACLFPGIIAQGARTSIPQELERVARQMPIFPLDVDAGAGGQIYLDRLGVYGNRSQGNRHSCSIAQEYFGLGVASLFGLGRFACEQRRGEERRGEERRGEERRGEEPFPRPQVEEDPR